MLHFALNKKETNLTNDDIAGSKPQCVKFTTKREPCNPLEPVYKLQSFEYVPPPVPKFIRDSIQHDDIDGSKTRKPVERPEKEIMRTTDIEGAQAKQQKARTVTTDPLDYKDVYARNWQSKRQTNPLVPVYQVRDNITQGDFLKKDATALNSEYGHVKGSVPQVLPDARSGVRNL